MGTKFQGLSHDFRCKHVAFDIAFFSSHQTCIQDVSISHAVITRLAVNAATILVTENEKDQETVFTLMSPPLFGIVLHVSTAVPTTP